VKRGWLGLWACLALTCARPKPVELAHAESVPRKGSAPPARSAATLPSALPVAASTAAPSPPLAPRGPLSNFFDALRQLSTGARAQHVRVLWLGDSHTNADFMSGRVRAALSERFGDGGPGFVRIATKPYRHEGLKTARDGAWNVDPDPPARRAVQDDGVFGIGGTRAVPGPGAIWSAQVVAARPGVADDVARFELSYTLPGDASFELELGDKRLRVDATSSKDVAASGISHLSLSGKLTSSLTLRPHRGRPRLFGLIIEQSARLGVVVDTSGIDGARLETPLAWNEPAFVAEVARRAPELFVLAYGTNEAFDRTRVEKYAPQLAELVRRVRAGAPHASCLVLGPTDAPLGDGSVARVAEVSAVLGSASAALGCSFVGLQRLMGGEGSFARGMKAKPRLAQPDRLHLTPRGYQELGQALGKLLLDAYALGQGDLP
jgi:lysophospholipase L1-like esterase